MKKPIIQHARTRAFIEETNQLITCFLYWLLLPNENPTKKIRINASKRVSNKLWKELQREIIKHPCSVCGGKSEAVHHIIPVCVRPEVQLDKHNLVPICKKCHRLQHPELSEALFK